MKSILLIWRMLIEVIGQELQDLKSGIFRRRRFTMSEVRQRVHDTIRKRYF